MQHIKRRSWFLSLLLPSAFFLGMQSSVLSAQETSSQEAPPQETSPMDGQSGSASIEGTRFTALTLYGQPPKYTEGFTHFDWVNPNAPKGGTVRSNLVAVYDNFNPFAPQGVAGVGRGYFETLMETSSDDPFALYPLIAQAVILPEDRSWIIFELNPKARFNNGEAVRSEDVVFSFEALTAPEIPLYAAYYADVEKVEALDETRVRFRFKGAGNKELPLIIGQLPILSKTDWEGHSLAQVRTSVPVTSAPYQVTDFSMGKEIVLKADPQYWGKGLPLNQGRYNFARLERKVFLDRNTAHLAFMAGELDYWFETTAKRWATAYDDLEEIKSGELIKKTFENGLVKHMVGSIFNTRREPFNDPAFRRALIAAFDFELLNKTQFYKQYTRTASFFQGTDLASSGLPQGREREILQQYKDQLPSEIFEHPYILPSSEGKSQREYLRVPFEILKDAGYVFKKGKLYAPEAQKKDDPIKIELLLFNPDMQRVYTHWVNNLNRLGIEASLKVVQSSVYAERLNKFDYDMYVGGFAQSLSPGNEQRDYWGSAFVSQPGGRNYAGVRDPVVDGLIEQLVLADTREELKAYSQALDRVLLWKNILIPHWYSDPKVLYWSRLKTPEKHALRESFYAVPSSWWIEE